MPRAFEKVPVAIFLVFLGCGSSTQNSSGTDSGSDAGSDAAPSEGGGDGGTLAPSGCLTDVTAGTHVFSCEGLSVDVVVPAACTGGGCGLVLDVHGALCSGPIEEAHMAIRPIAEAKGYVVVQPSANIVTSVGGPFWTSTDDDRILKILDAVEGVFRTDASRTHMTGFSQGGYMTWRFLCKHADRFASVAPAAAAQPTCGQAAFFESCAFDATSSPSREIDVLFLEGRKDGVVPFTCMTAERDAAIAAWGLTQKTDVSGDAQYARTRYANARGTVLETIEHDYTTDPQGALAANVGHCYPGSQANLGNIYDQFACKGPNAFAWGKEVMDFFVSHPKK